jgi:membrane dipeptidase
MNRLGMLVDLSHVSDSTFFDAIAVSTAPVIASHSSARAINEMPRNLTDDQLRAVTKNGGVVNVNFYSRFLDPDFRTGTQTPFHVLIDHFDHIAKVAGVDHVGIGSDFDGVSALPEGMEDVTRLPRIAQALLDRGYSEADVQKMLGGNMLRVMEQAMK